jgi:hypothetical protein
MTAPWLVVALLVGALPVAVFGAFVWSSTRLAARRRGVLATLGLGALSQLPLVLATAGIERLSGLALAASGGSARLTTLAYDVVVVAPLTQAITVAAVWPALRVRRIATPFEGVSFAAAAAVGRASALGALLVVGSGEGLSVLRAAMLVPAHVFLAALWGHALGRSREGFLGSPTFNLSWLGATLLSGLYDHLVLRGGGGSLASAAPILLTFCAVAFATRDVVRRSPRRRPSSLRVVAPSMQRVREALRKGERRVMLGWILFGALVTAGVMTTTLAGSVAVGHVLGVDFAAIDRDTSAAATTPPLGLLGLGALSAFPIAGFLVAKAAGVRTVLEPAMSATLAILGTLVLLGLAAPIAVVFAVAFAPIAFGLACAGAWMGLAR